jgi:general secretion pathway protein D
MNTQTSFALLCRQVSRRFPQTLLLVGVAGFLGGCVSPTPRSLATLTPIDQKTIGALNANLAEESAKLDAARDETLKLIERRQPQPAAAPIAPVHDPLEDIIISVKLQNATLSSLLQVFSDQAHMNMLVDPEVLAIDKRASFYLNRVSARELYRHILEAFDLAGEVTGNTTKIDLFEERFFNIDFLNARMTLDVSGGGNVFGSNSGGATGASGDQIRGNISLNGGTGKQVESYEQLELNLKQLMGLKEGSSQPNDQDQEKKRPVFSLNKSSGTLFVRARPSQMRMVEKMIGHYKTVLRRQVLIEAQLLDVQLNDQFQYGVDWNILRDNVAAVVGSAPITASTFTSALPFEGQMGALRTLTFPSQAVGSSNAPGAGLTYSRGTVNAAINMLRGFGNVKVLSNPSIRVRNNVPALLSVGSSNRFVAKSSVTVTNPGGTGGTTTADVQTDSVFSGVIIGVVPFIGESGNVELLINPMQTEVDATSLQLQDVGGGNKVTLPKITFKGMTTTLNIQDGDTVIIGGLIDQSTSGNDRGTPGLSDAPLFGKLFGNEATSHLTREMVIVLKVKLL